jgi:hypothetical protein
VGEDFRTPILQAHPTTVALTAVALSQKTDSSPAELTANRPPPVLSLAPVGTSFGSDLSIGGRPFGGSGSVLVEKQMTGVIADWKAQDAKRLERERRAEAPLTRAVDYVIPESKSYRMGNHDVGGGARQRGQAAEPLLPVGSVFLPLELLERFNRAVAR